MFRKEAEFLQSSRDDGWQEALFRKKLKEIEREVDYDGCEQDLKMAKQKQLRHGMFDEHCEMMRRKQAAHVGTRPHPLLSSSVSSIHLLEVTMLVTASDAFKPCVPVCRQSLMGLIVQPVAGMPLMNCRRGAKSGR